MNIHLSKRNDMTNLDKISMPVIKCNQVLFKDFVVIHDVSSIPKVHLRITLRV